VLVLVLVVGWARFFSSPHPTVSPSLCLSVGLVEGEAKAGDGI